MGHLEHAIVFPLGAPGDVRGTLTIARRRGALPFPPGATDFVASFAAQAGVAIELADRRAAAERLSVYEDRDRIARDLHDLVIQRLYATGMSLEGTMPMVTRPEVADRITNAVDAMDETIKVIRTTIFALQSRGGSAGPKLRAEIVALAEDAAGRSASRPRSASAAASIRTATPRLPSRRWPCSARRCPTSPDTPRPPEST